MMWWPSNEYVEDQPLHVACMNLFVSLLGQLSVAFREQLAAALYLFHQQLAISVSANS
jgi:hypothetical protein